MAFELLQVYRIQFHFPYLLSLLRGGWFATHDTQCVILVTAIPNRRAQTIKDAFTKLHCHLVSAGLRPQLQHLDNEASKILKDYMHDQHIDFQLVPPHMHRHNAAERAICTFKNHFIASLCSTKKNSQYICGIASYLKQPSPSISYVPPAYNHNSLHMHTALDNLILIAHRMPHPAQESSYTTNRSNAPLRHHLETKDGT